ncbi:MAG: carbohydrate kinase family protein, partial [Clostridia bacterium]|nr:carbohydrate kinase family protein [Clostridia bacterium]
MSNAKKGITVAGSLIADVFYEIDTYPNEGFLSTVRATSMNIGGSGNMILDLAKLDENLKVKVLAIIGQDKGGQHLQKVLAQFPNIDTENMTVEDNSSVTLVMNAADTKQRTFFFVPEASDHFGMDYINWDTVDTKIFQLEYILLMKKVDSPDPEYGTHGARILAEAKKRGMITSIDVVSEQSDRAKDVVRAALKYTDICCINESEAQAVTGITVTENGNVVPQKVFEAIEKIRALGVSKWIVVHAPKCGYGYDCESGERFVVPSLKLPAGYIKGSTGAGDAYCSGILYGAHEDKTLEEAMRLARASAACSLSENNGTDGLRSADLAMKLE